jgi:hypothetical protein
LRGNSRNDIVELKLPSVVKLLLCSFVFLSNSQFGQAQESVRLFPANLKSRPSSSILGVDGYEVLLGNLRPGDDLQFSDGSQFEFLERLGRGKTTEVLKVRAKTGEYSGVVMALRVPIKSDLLSLAQHWEHRATPVADPALSYTFSLYIDDSYAHIKIFERGGIGPKFYQYLPGQYLALELIERQFSLGDFLSGKVVLDKESTPKIVEALVDFERRISGVIEIQDFLQMNQVFFNGERFVLIDWFNVEYVSSNLYPWAFYEWPGLVGNFLKMIMYTNGRPDPKDERMPFWKDIHDRLEKTHKKARLEMLDKGVNPLTGQALVFTPNYFERTFGAWKNVYRDLDKLRRAKQCKKWMSPF